MERGQTLHNTTWLEFDAEALRHNAMVVKQLAPHGAILAMLKANGYGHGADWAAAQLADKVQGFGLARLSEALALRASQAQAKILLLGTLVDDDTLQHCAHARLDLVIHRLADAQALCDSTLPAPITVWLKRNVGMNRLGLSGGDFSAAHQLLARNRNVSGIIHMSHFSDADDVASSTTVEQAQCLFDSSAGLGTFPRSLANSAAIIAHPGSHADWQRPGIMLYGDDPTGLLRGDQQLRAVMNFKSRVLAIRELQAGEGVGYNRRWRANSSRRIATVGAGYADGYPRHAADGTPVLVNGQRAVIAGRVSMDLLTVDVSEIDKVSVGDEVTLWGDGLPAAEVAKHCQTISYELFTGVTARVTRHY